MPPPCLMLDSRDGVDGMMCRTSLSPDRCQMNADTGADYLRPWKLGKAIEGTGIGLVEQSEFEGLAPGDIVRSFTWPWQLRSTLPGASLNKIDPAIVGGHVSHFLGAVGLSGLTALLGIRVKGHIRQNANQTVLISGAAGSCGHLAGQIARLEGAATVVGICGSEEKCRVLVEELGFDGAINYKKKNVEAELQSCCPRGIDVYFDNVGGDISNSVIRQMNEGGHIVLCGQISQYNKDVPYPPPLLNDIEQVLHQRSITRERFLVLHYQERFAESVAQLAAWLADGKLKLISQMNMVLTLCMKWQAYRLHATCSNK
uniref:Prostaglandin reductase 2 n=1 Tax=Eptatretus burgeri TaxID=7764 RepID=A0A8C4R9P4_EPTBU